MFAVDYSPLLVDHLEKTCREMRLDNVTTVRCSADSVNLADHSIDLAFICDTYRYFRSPRKNMRSLHRALRKHGTVVVIDSHQSRNGATASPHDASPAGVSASPELIEEIESAGFKLVGVETFLMESYFLRFEKTAPDE